MDTYWMGEKALTEVSHSDAFNSNQLMHRQAMAHDRAKEIGHVWAGERVLRVLIIDDKQDAADILVRLVCLWGHTFRMAYDAHSALRVAAAQRPDVVLLDLEMRLVDGWQVAQQLRLDFPRKECLIIAFTNWADGKRRQQLSEAGIDLVLIKPTDPGNLETLLMLECVRVNRSHSDNAERLAKKGASQFARLKPSDEVRAGVPLRHRALDWRRALATHNNRMECHETGGSSCWS